MRHGVCTVLLAACLATLPLRVAASTWELDPAHSRVGFKVRHMMITNVRGEFRDFQGTLQLDEQEPARSTVRVTIQAASIDTGVEKRDEHLRSADFFDAANFPVLSFESTGASPAEAGTMRLKGTLTIRGVTREVLLTVDGPTAHVTDLRGDLRMGASASTTIDRREFGLVWNKALEAGGWAVGEEVTIELDTEWVKKAP